MIGVDIGILAIIGVSALISLVRGFTREALSLAGWVAAFWVALIFTPKVSRWLAPHISPEALRVLMSFILLFVVMLILSALVNFLVGRMLKKSGLSATDRLVGLGFGIVRGSVIVAVLVLLAGLTALPREAWWDHSLLLGPFQSLAVWARGFLPADIARAIQF